MWHRFIRPLLKRLFGPAKRRFAENVLSGTRKVVFVAGPDEIRRAVPKIPILFRDGAAADLDRFDGAYDYSGEGLAFARARLAAGDRFVVGEFKGRIVFYVWMMFRQFDLNTGVYLPMSADRAYVYKAYVLEDFRRFGLFSAFFSDVAQWLKAHGYRELVLQVRADNGPSLAATKRAGFRRAGGFMEWRVFGRLRFTVPAGLRRLLLTPVESEAKTAASR